MNKLRSEVLYNRAMIWTAISLIQGYAGKTSSAWISMIPACYCAWKSFKAWNEADE